MENITEEKANVKLLDKRDANGRTSLILLCLEKEKKILDAVKDLLKIGNIDVNAIDNQGDSALTLLCKHYRKDDLIDIIELLVELKVDMNVKNKEGKNALILLFVSSSTRESMSMRRITTT